MNSITSNGSYGSNLQAFAAAAPQWNGKSSRCSSWFESVANALGGKLDQQAAELEDLSGDIARGDDKPQTMARLSAASQLMNIKSNVVHTVITSIGGSMEKLSQK